MSRLSLAVVLGLYVGAFGTALLCPCVADTGAPRSHGCCETAGLRQAAPACCTLSAAESVPAALSPLTVVTPPLPSVLVPVAAPVAAPLPPQPPFSSSGPSSAPPILRI